MAKSKYNAFGRIHSEPRIIEIPGLRNFSNQYFSKETVKIFKTVTKDIISLVASPAIMNYWRSQIDKSYQEGSGSVNSLPKAYFILAKIHDRYGGLNRIVTKELDEKQLRDFRITYYPIDCETYLENVKADLAGNGLYSIKSNNAEDPKKTRKGKGRNKISGVENKQKEIKERFSFSPGQICFDENDLKLPTGFTIDVFIKLYDNWGKTVLYKTLDDNSEKKSASEQLKNAKNKIQEALKNNKTHCTIENKPRTGYLITQTIHNK